AHEPAHFSEFPNFKHCRNTVANCEFGQFNTSCVELRGGEDEHRPELLSRHCREGHGAVVGRTPMLTAEEKKIVKRARDQTRRIGAKAPTPTADGLKCVFTDPLAQRFCGHGALLAECAAAGRGVADAEALAKSLVPYSSLVAINDYDGHTAVLALF